MDGCARAKLPFQERPSQRIFQVDLDCALQWSRTIYRIISSLTQLFSHCIRQLKSVIHVFKTRSQIGQLHIQNTSDVFTSQGMENNRLIDTINEFRTEMSPNNTHDRIPNGFMRLPNHALNQI